jgi:hypothetical protein
VLAVACVLPVLVPIGRYEYTAEFQSLALLPWQSLPGSRLVSAAFVAAFTLGCAALWATSRRETVGRLWLLAGATMVITGVIALLAHAERAANSATPVSVGSATWVDDAVPAGSRVAILWDERRVRGEVLDSFYPWVMITEFFNPSVEDVYRLGPETYYERFLSTVPVRQGPDGSIVRVDGAPVTADYVLATCRLRLDGVVVARSVADSLVLARVQGPVRVAAGPTCRKTAP